MGLLLVLLPMVVLAAAVTGKVLHERVRLQKGQAAAVDEGPPSQWRLLRDEMRKEHELLSICCSTGNKVDTENKNSALVKAMVAASSIYGEFVVTPRMYDCSVVLFKFTPGV